MRFIFVIALLFVTRAFGATFIVEDDSLVSIPTAVTAGVRKFEKDMPTNYNGEACKFVGKTVALRDGGTTDDWIVTTANACSWAASAAPVWVLIKISDGEYQVVLFHVTYDLTVGSTAQNGLRHIATARATVARQENQLWKFDGKVYKLAKMRIF